MDGEDLPAGCDVGTGIYAIHHNAAYFPDPFAFMPERWIIGARCPGGMITTKESLEQAQSAFTPFSIGPRACIGKRLAMMELMWVCASILCEMDYGVVEGEEGRVGEGKRGMGRGREREGEFQLWDHVTAAKEGLVLRWRRRRGGGGRCVVLSYETPR